MIDAIPQTQQDDATTHISDANLHTSTGTANPLNKQRNLRVRYADRGEGSALDMKCVPFYGDVYGSSFFNPLLTFANYGGGNVNSEDANSSISILSSPFFQERRSFYQAVPTEETSMGGRQRAAKERRKKSQTRRKKRTPVPQFHYNSYISEGNGPTGEDKQLFSLVEFMKTEPSDGDGDKIPALRLDNDPGVGTTGSCPAIVELGLPYDFSTGNTADANMMQRLLSNEDEYSGTEVIQATTSVDKTERCSDTFVHVASPVHPQEASVYDQTVLDSTVLEGQSHLDCNAFGQTIETKKTRRVQKKRDTRPRDPISESLQNNGITEQIGEANDPSLSFAPKPKRRASTKDGAYKRDKNNQETRGPSSRFRGVTRHRRSGRWEAHIWIKEMGRQVYLGGYEKEEHAAEAYDIAALKSKGTNVKTNFDSSKYSELAAEMDSITLDELVMIVRRKSQGFSRGTSRFRGVTHHPSGRWEARIGIPGSKHIYLGLYNDEYEAARWYDRALVRLRGLAAATNFLLSNYRQELTEHHEMQHALRTNDGSSKGNVKLNPNFEHWVKFGTSGILTTSEMDSETVPLLYSPPPSGHDTIKDAQPDAEDETTNQKKQLVAQLVMQTLAEHEYLPVEFANSDDTTLHHDPNHHEICKL